MYLFLKLVKSRRTAGTESFQGTMSNEGASSTRFSLSLDFSKWGRMRTPRGTVALAPLNGDQLCGHVYVAWPNYSNNCCRQQIKVSWDMEYIPGRKWSQSNTVSAQSSCLNSKTISVSGFKSWDYKFIFVFHDLISDIVITSGNPTIWMDQSGLPGA